MSAKNDTLESTTRSTSAAFRPGDRRDEYDFYLSVLSEVLPSGDEDSTVESDNNCEQSVDIVSEQRSSSDSSSAAQDNEEEEDDESSVGGEEYAVPRNIGRVSGCRWQPQGRLSLSLRESHCTVPLEVFVCQQEDDYVEEASLSHEGVMVRESSQVHLSGGNGSNLTMEALGQLSVSASIGSLPRSRGIRHSGVGSPPFRSCNNSFPNGVTSMPIGQRRRRSCSIEGSAQVSNLVRESRSYPSILDFPAAAAGSIRGIRSQAPADQPPRRPRQGLRIDLSDNDSDDDVVAAVPNKTEDKRRSPQRQEAAAQ